MRIDIHHGGVRLGWAETPLSSHVDAVKLNGSYYPLELQGDYGYVDLDVTTALNLKSNLHRVNKDIYIASMFSDLLRKYHDRFKQNASIDLHEYLRQQATKLVGELW